MFDSFPFDFFRRQKVFMAYCLMMKLQKMNVPGKARTSNLLINSQTR